MFGARSPNGGFPDRETERSISQAPTGTSTSAHGSPSFPSAEELSSSFGGSRHRVGLALLIVRRGPIGGGGGAVTAWILGISLVFVLALVRPELGTMFPIDGGMARFPLYAFGRITGFFSGWFRVDQHRLRAGDRN